MRVQCGRDGRRVADVLRGWPSCVSYNAAVMTKPRTSAAKPSRPAHAAPAAATPVSRAKAVRPLTLCIDIGGTGLKMMVVDAAGKPVTERLRELTPPKPSPEKVLELLYAMRERIGSFDRVSVGFPGVVKHGHTLGAFNLDPAWTDFALQQTLRQKWRKPVRVANDAAIQGLGAIRGKGVELCLTLGTGMGSSLFVDGRLCPGLELAHHPWKDNKTYEDFVGRRGLLKFGHKRWNKLVAKVIAQTQALFNWDSLHIGGGNAKHLTIELPEHVRIVPNEDGLLGGVALWRDLD